MQALMMPAFRKLIFSVARVDRKYEGATKFAMTLTAIVTMTSARQASDRNRVFGIAATMSVGLSMIVPSIWNWAPHRMNAMTANARTLTNRPQKLPRTTAVFDGERREKSQKLRIRVP